MAVLPHPIDTLLEVSCPQQRARAHVQLGQQARQDHRVQVAIRHFEEAMSLDPTSVEPKEALRSMGRAAEPRAQGSRRSMLGRFMRGTKRGG